MQCPALTTPDMSQGTETVYHMGSSSILPGRRNSPPTACLIFACNKGLLLHIKPQQLQSAHKAHLPQVLSQRGFLLTIMPAVPKVCLCMHPVRAPGIVIKAAPLEPAETADSGV